MKTTFFGGNLHSSFFKLRMGALSALFLVLSGAVGSAAIIFSENMGTGASSGGTAISANTFQNSGALTFSGTGDVRTTTPSDYNAASGSDNIFLTTGGAKSFQIAGISTVGFSSLSLSFGAFKSTTASTMSELTLEYSIDDGSTYSVLAIPTQSGGATWRLISGISLPSNAAGVADLRLQWINTSASSVMFRLDDVTLTGTAVPEPAGWGLISALGLLGICGVSTWRKQCAMKRDSSDCS